VQTLAEDLRCKTSPMAILKCLDAIRKGLEDELNGEKVAFVLLRARVLPTLIRHVRGSTSSTPDVDPDHMHNISMQAAVALTALLGYRKAVMQEVRVTTGLIMSLIDILRDGPTIISRWLTETALWVLVTAKPSQAEAMVNAGVMGLLLQLRIDVADMDPSFVATLGTPGAKLGSKLLESGSAAARDLEQAIRSPDILQCFGALVLLQVPPCSLSPAVCWAIHSRTSSHTIARFSLRWSFSPVSSLRAISQCTSGWIVYVLCLKSGPAVSGSSKPQALLLGQQHWSVSVDITTHTLLEILHAALSEARHFCTST
jgi:hypothetical protein